MRILVVEDDAQVASFIRRGLREEQFAVDTAADGDEAIFAAGSGEYDLIILDWRLPKRSGIDVLQALRADGITIPILMLTVRDELVDKITGFDAGADDYLTKPFSFDELLARVRALLRRRGSLVATVMRVDDLELDSLRHRVTRRGQRIELTNREYAVLEYLMRNAGRVVSRTMLAEHVWEQDFDPLSNVIDVHVARLRRKIDGDFDTKVLQTMRGSGYVLQAPEAGEPVDAGARDTPEHEGTKASPQASRQSPEPAQQPPNRR